MKGSSAHGAHAKGSYRSLLLMSALSFVTMYALMYAMVDRFENVFASWNQVYMAGLMTAPMVLIELLLMRSMYPDKKRNAVLVGVSLLAAVGCFALIRGQVGISDKQFLRSMIPHHAGAILMCGEASIEDPEIRRLCEGIRAGQQAEIDQMKAILERLGR
jgi:uncharacterized protein (DUF305 family)